MNGPIHASSPARAPIRILTLLALCLLAWHLLPTRAGADDLPPDASHLPDIELGAGPGAPAHDPLPLPSWGSRSQTLTPRLWPGGPGSPGGAETATIPEVQLPPKVDPTVIPDLYLTDYFGTLPETYLVDPQTLLTAHERSSINRVLEEHFTNHQLPVYILLFDRQQQIPEFQNLKALQARWFGERPGVVVGFWLAAPTRTNAFFGHALRKEYGSRVDRAFADALGQSYTKTYPFSQLDHFTYTLLWRLAHLDKDSAAPPDASGDHPHHLATLPEFPPINSNGWIPIAVAGLALSIGVAAIGAGIILAHRKHGLKRGEAKPLILPVSARAERLGAPHSGGSGATVRAVQEAPKIPS